MFNKIKKIKIIIGVLTLLALFPLGSINGSELADDVAGRILLQVESDGKAWYVDPENKWRSFLGRPADAFSLMREQGVGIKNSDLKKIPIGLLKLEESDQDGDGLGDNLEKAIGISYQKNDTDGDGFSDYDEIKSGFNPIGQGDWATDASFVYKNKGRIFLQVESRGEAWYVYPVDGHRYYLGRPVDALRIMRSLGLGISNQDINKIISVTPNFLLTDFAASVYDRVNSEREAGGLNILKWNEYLADVAREHSEDLAQENAKLTGMGKSCDMPFIHHEGLVFGLTVSERLHNRDIYYFDKDGENIALMAGATYKVVIEAGDNIEEEVLECQNKRTAWDKEYKQVINTEEGDEKKEEVKKELARRKEVFDNSREFEIASIEWYSLDKIAENTVQGWMDSPGHKENMLNSDYTETGIGSAYVNGYLITTQIFITRVGCGYQTGPCCHEAGYYPYCFIPLECNFDICQKE